MEGKYLFIHEPECQSIELAPHKAFSRFISNKSKMSISLNSDSVRLIMGFNISDCFLSMSSVCEGEAYIRHIPLIVLLFLEDLYPLQD